MRTSTDSLRINWVDVLRGYGLAFVVLGHVLIGLMHAHRIGHPAVASYLIIFFYLFHMPLIFFVSGYVSKDGRKRFSAFILSLLKWIVAPYVIWSVAMVALQALTPSEEVNRPADWSSLPGIGWHPILLYWFLYALFWIRLIDYAVSRWLPITALRRGLVGMAIAGLLVMFWQFNLSDDVPFKFGAGLLFFALGRLAGSSSERFERILASISARRWLNAAAIVSSLAIVAVFARFYLYRLADEGIEPFIFQAWMPLTGIAGIFGFLLISYAQAKRRWLVPLRSIGVYAMCIYVQHVIWGAGLRILLLKLGVMGDLRLVLLIWGGSIAAALVWQKAADWLGISALFGIRPVEPSFFQTRRAIAMQARRSSLD